MSSGPKGVLYQGTDKGRVSLKASCTREKILDILLVGVNF